MKQRIVMIVNIILVVALVASVGFFAWRSTRQNNHTAETMAQPTESERPQIPAEKYKIGIVQHADLPSSQKCYEGFVSELKDKGFFEYIDIVYVLEEDNEKCKAEIQRLINLDCDLLFTIGPFATKTAASLTSDIPIVFGAVNDPEEEGLVASNESPGGNVTGVSSYTPCFEQIDIIPLLLPEAKKVGALYCMTDENAVVQAIIAEKEAGIEEVSLAYERYPVLQASDIAGKLDAMKNDGVDVIYVPIDSLVYKHFDKVAQFASKNNIPIICGDEGILKKGGFATCMINYASIGRKSGDLSADILFYQKDPGTLPVIYKYECDNYVNQDVLKALGLTLSDEAMEVVQLKSYTEEK